MSRRANCREGRHTYGRKAAIGAGMARKSCSACGVVEIDVQSPETPARSQLFTRARLPSMFRLEVVLSNAEAEVEIRRSFGRPPADRRRAAQAVA